MSTQTAVAGCYFKKRIYSNEDASFMAVSYRSWDAKALPAPELMLSGGGFFEFVAVGRMLPELKEISITLEGGWKHDKEGRLQFSVDSYEYTLPEGDAQIAAVLGSNNMLGLSEGENTRVAARFGRDTFRVIMKEPERIRDEIFPGISSRRLNSASRSLTEKLGRIQTMAFLKKCGLQSPSRIYASLGDDAEEILKDNPYELCRVSGYGFGSAEKIARAIAYPKDGKERIFSALEAAIGSLSSARGDMFFDRKTVVSETAKLVPDLNGRFIEKGFMEAAKERRLIAFSDSHVFTAKGNAQELSVCRKAASLLADRTADDSLMESFGQWKLLSGFTLTPAQGDAIRNAASHRISIITGGAGTGKTTLVKALCESWQAAHPDGTVTLLSPTGRAAGRMTEATGIKAGTVHSTLRLDESGTGNGKIPEGLVVVDEASMVDSAVAGSLFSAIPGDTTLVICGDINQLPSVGPGQVLAELIDGGIPTTRLTTVMRQGSDSPILHNANLILDGRSSLDYTDGFTFTPADASDAQGKVVAEYFASIESFGIRETAILTPLRSKGPVSCNELNRRIQETFAPKNGRPYYVRGRAFYLNDRVMQTKNNRFAANGDVGTVTGLRFSCGRVSMDITFDAGFAVTYEGDEIDIIDLAYAITIHKSQGSEYRKAIIPLLYEFKGPLYNRNLLYTAVTRAKQAVSIIGDTKSVWYCTRNKARRRSSLLAARIKKSIRDQGLEP